MARRSEELSTAAAAFADLEPTYVRRYGGSNMDPLTLSLNTTRPAAVRALIRVAARAKEIADGEQAAAVVAADRVMDLLGRAGHVEIGDEVSKRRQRE